ncbi:hypothetical protein BDV95DRAFT_105346 [Massariosphaeria phaeospora]|uniref:Uncharacterized protein n=1 Tax=Massariosphaeria phaeospora TaxID=100035 RepID=A0A7C8I5S8_9PLEO|nr:hypothetical protein BDV95DRAFT_105346 [Massariosphaeria phaeospora]
MVFFILTLLLFSTQVQAIPEHGYDVDYWCNNVDLNNEEAVRNLWEEQGVCAYLDVLTHGSNTDELGPDNWPYKLLKRHSPNLGNDETSGCGIPSSQICDPKIDCADMVKNGNGYGGNAYWAIQGLKGFHSNTVAHEYLQDATIDNIMSLKGIAQDFTTPDNFAKLVDFLSIFGACFYMVGSAAGMVNVAASRAGAGPVPRLGVLNAQLDMMRKNPKAYTEIQVKNVIDATTKTSSITSNA